MILEIIEVIVLLSNILGMIYLYYKIKKLHLQVGNEKRKLLKYKTGLKARPKDDETKDYPEVEI